MNYYTKILEFYFSSIWHLLLIKNYLRLSCYLNSNLISTSCLFHLYLALFISRLSLCPVSGSNLAALIRIFDGILVWGLGIMLGLGISGSMILKIRFIFLGLLLFLRSSNAPILKCCIVYSNCYISHSISTFRP